MHDSSASIANIKKAEYVYWVLNNYNFIQLCNCDFTQLIGMVSSNFSLLWTRQLTCTLNSLLSFFLQKLCIVTPKDNPVYNMKPVESVERNRHL
jgi:hypothetical protein